MTETKNIAVLFDFDGVVVDTETQYSIFWHKWELIIWVWKILKAA